MPRGLQTSIPTDELLLETGILPPGCDDALMSAYRKALEEESVTLTDALTIRDLLHLTGFDTPTDCALHCLLIALCAGRNQGSLCLHADPETLGGTVGQVTGQSPAPDEVRRLLAGLESGAYAGLVSTGDPGAPVVFERGGPHLYFQRYFQHERRLKDALLARTSGGAVRSAFEPRAAREAAVAASRYARFAGERRGLNEEQLCGVYLALRNGFTIISGGPGTGKTTLVTSILRALVASGTPVERICLVAPTGRAGQRMGEAIQNSLTLAGNAVEPDVRDRMADMAGSTIHRLLKFNPARNDYTYGPGNPLPADVVICDEVSMVDVVLMDRLLAALRDDAKVVFLGDKDQLPSVEAGAVLGDLIPRNPVPLYSPAMKAELAELCAAGASLPTAGRITPLTDRIVLLTESHRARGPVLETASQINSGSTAAVGGMRVEAPRPVSFVGLVSGGRAARRGVLGVEWQRFGDECVRLEPGAKPLGTLRQVLLSWTDALFQQTREGVSLGELLRRELCDADLSNAMLAPAVRRHILVLFDLMQQSQILTLVRHGGFGCEGINRFLAEFWRDRLDPRRARSSQIFSGAPIIVTRNDHRRNLFNGDTGIVLRASDSGRCHAVFRRGDAVSVFPVETLPDHELCFAMTVHKSQGSEYGNVLLVLPANRNHPLLTREIVYTGITRTRGNAFVFASEAALRGAVARRIERHSGIDLWSEGGEG